MTAPTNNAATSSNNGSASTSTAFILLEAADDKQVQIKKPKPAKEITVVPFPVYDDNVSAHSQSAIYAENYQTIDEVEEQRSDPAYLCLLDAVDDLNLSEQIPIEQFEPTKTLTVSTVLKKSS